MCYSSSLTSKNIDLSKKFKREIPSEIADEPLFHASGFSFPEWKIVTTSSAIEIMRWGLIPNWFNGDKTADFTAMTLNARSESILEKPSFKHLVGRQHCIVPSTGFFEYQKVGKESIPYFVYPTQDEFFSMAGIYDHWHNPLTGKKETTFSIITCEANEIMAEIHNTKKRMPVMLQNDALENWLVARPNEIGDFLVPNSNESIAAHKINPKIVSGPDHNSPEVLKVYFDPRDAQRSLF